MGAGSHVHRPGAGAGRACEELSDIPAARVWGKGGVAALAGHMVPCQLDEEVWLPTTWNVNVKAGTLATTLDHEDEGHSWGGRG